MTKDKLIEIIGDCRYGADTPEEIAIRILSALKKEYGSLLKWARGHYWDSIDKGTVILHLKDYLK